MKIIISDKFKKLFCYPLHFLFILFDNIPEHTRNKAYQAFVETIFVTLLFLSVNAALIWIAYFLLASTLYKPMLYGEIKKEEFVSEIIPFSTALENSISWLSIEKKHPIYVFGIGKEIIVIPEYFGNEISEYVLEAVNGEGNFVDVECFRIKRNEIRKLACRFAPIGDSDYKIEYLRIVDNNVEVIGVDE